MSRVSSVRVIVAHQDPLLAAGVAATFQAADGFEIVSQDGSSTPPPHWTQTLYPAAVLVADYDTGLRHARHASVRGTILIVTHFHDEARIRRAIQHGIRGYLLQGCSTEALIQGVLALHRGATAFAPVVGARIAESLTHQSLTDRELTVLRHLMLRLSNKEISRKMATTPTVDLMMRERIHPEDVATRRQVVERATPEGQDFAHEYRLRMPDDRVKHLHVVAHAVRTETGDVDFVGAVKDITEQKRAQAESERLEERLRQAAKMEAVGRFASGIAHDFNSVLAGVFGYGEMLVEKIAADSPLKRYAQNVLTAATRGRELVEQILTYSRSQRGKREPVDVADVVAETLELLRGSLPAGISLEASAPASPLVVIGNATQLHQVVMNLCTNAIQAMRAGGILRVMLETAELSGERALSHGTLGAGGYLRLIVEDSGSGIEEATLARIFEPFFTTKKVGEGTGLGLSLVYAIVTDSGGAIDVKSAPQQGTTFTIYLPRSGAPLATTQSGHTTPPRGHGEPVLLIDHIHAVHGRERV